MRFSGDIHGGQHQRLPTNVTAHGCRRAATRPLRTLAVVLAALAALLALPLPVAGQMTSTEVVLTVAPAVVSEGAGATELTVTGTLDGDALMQETEVALSVRAGSATEHYDYTAGTATLTIAESQTSGTAALTLTPLDEHLYQRSRHEPDETVTVVGTVAGLTVQGAQVTITDNDPPPVVHPMLEEECETTDVWCAEMTVGRVLVNAGGDVHAHETNAGYDATLATGALRPDSFELGGVSYTVDRLYGAATSTIRLLFLKTSPSLLSLPKADRDALVLRVGGQAYPLSESDIPADVDPDDDDPGYDADAIGWTEDRQRTLASGVVRPWAFGQRVTARLTGLKPPGAPGSLAARFGDGEVRLSWTRPPDGGAPITRYQYRQMSSGDTTWNPDWTDIQNSGADTTSYTVGSLTNGTAYTFEVRARNRIGAGAESNQATDTPNAAQMPAAPGGLHAVVGSEQLTLAWTAPAYRGAPVTKYQHRYKVSSDTNWNPDWTDIQNSGADTTSYTVGSLTNGTTYRLEVRAVSSAGNGAEAATSGTPSADPVPVTVSFGAVSGAALEGPMPDDAAPRVQPTEVVVSLSAPPGRQVVIPVTAAGAAGATPQDWVLATDTGLTFAAVAADLTFGAAATSRTILVLAAADEEVDPGERVRLAFGALPAGVSAGDPRTATVSLLDTNAIPYRIVVAAPERVVEGEPVPITLTATSLGSERPRYSFQIIFETRSKTPKSKRNVIDLDKLGGTRRFDGSRFVRHGDRWVATQVYEDTVTTIDDDRAEGDETFEILAELKLGTERELVEFAGSTGVNQFLTVTIEEDDHAPAVTTSSPIPALTGGTAAATLAATDADGDPLTWSLAGGADESHFALTSAGVLSFLSAKEIDGPDDADRDGVYQVTVQVTDDHNPVTAELAVQLVSVLPDVTPVAPGAPTGLTARADGAYEIVLSWTAPDDDGGAPVTGYQIEELAAGSWTDVEADTASSATGYVHAGRTPETAYRYRVSAINTAGTGAASAEAAATTGPDLVCARTEAVRDAILAAVAGVSACGKVTAAHLADVTVLDVLLTSAPATLAAGDFAGLTALASLFLDGGTERLTSLPAALFDGLSGLTTLDLSGNQLGLAAGTFAGLTSLATLDLSGNELTGLPAGVFAEVSTLTTLDLSGNDFVTVPAGMLADLSALTTLDLSGNDLATLPAGLFADLSALATLDLSGNDFATLPAGLFTGLPALTALDLSGNPGAPLALTVSLQAAGDGRIEAVAPAGAPFRLELPVSADNGTFGAGSDATAVLAIAAGAVQSAPLFVARAAGTTAPVTANLGRPLPLPPPDHHGYDLAAAADGLPLEVLGSGVATPAGLVVDAPAPLAVDEGADASYTVALATEPTADVTVTVSGHAGTDLTLDFASLTFTTTSWGTARTVTVSAGQDMDMADDAVTLTHEASGGGYGSVATEMVSVRVADDDEAAWTVTVAPAMIAEADRGAAAVTVDTGGFLFAAAQAIGLDFAGGAAAVQRDFMVADSGGAALAAPYRLTLAAGATAASATLTAVDDGVAESEEEIRITARHAGSAVGTVGIVTIVDDTRPGVPTGLTATADGAYEIDLSWMAPAQTGGTAIRGYKVEVSDDAGLNWTQVTGNTESPATTYEHGSRMAQTSYRYRVSAINHSDTGEPSDHADATTADDLVCGRTGAVRDAIVAAVFGARADAGDSCGKASAGQLGALPRLDLGGNGISTLPASDLDGLTGLTELDLSGNTLSDLPWPAIATLTGLTELDLGSNQLTSVPASAFASLTALTELDLGSNQLTSVPASAFASLTALTELDLGSNQLTSVPASAFASLTALTELDLGSNQLTTLPAGVFGGLTEELTTLDLGNNAAALSLEVSLLTAGEGQFKAAVREGAPFAIELPLTVSGGTIDGGESTVTIPVGGVESDALGVTRTTADAVSVDIGTPLPAPRTGHTGYALARSADGLPLEVLAAAPAVASVMVSSDPGDDDTYAIGDAVAATVTFSEAVDVDTTDGTPRLEIDVGGTPQPLSFGAGSGTATLTFTGYTVAEGNEDTDGIAVAANKLSRNSGAITKAGDSSIAAFLAHAEVPADAAHLVDGVRPTLSAAATSTGGASIELTFSEPLLAATATASAFTVTVDAAARGVDSVAAAGTAVTLTLSAAVNVSHTVTVAYADPSGDDDANAVQDSAGNDAPTFAARQVTNNLPSTKVTLSVMPDTVAEDAGGTELTVTGTLNGAVRTGATEVTLTVEAGTATATDDYTTGAAPTLTIDAGDRSGTATLTLTPEDDPDDEPNETVTIGGTVTGGALTVNAAELTITDNDELPGAPTLTAEPGDQEVTLRWTAPTSAGTSTIDGYDYRVSDDTVAPFTWDPDWTAIPDSGAGGANASSYTVTMHGGSTLANGTSYTFAVRARSAAGEGKAAQDTAKPGEVCGRTAQVRDAIVREAPVSACEDVTASHLAAITALHLAYAAVGDRIEELKTGDFAGLTGMNNLALLLNHLTTLPEGIFSGLTALTDLDLNTNLIEALPAGVFDDLTALQTLDLSWNRLTELPAGIFDKLTALKNLSLARNDFASLRADVFGNLAALEKLELTRNDLTELPATIFANTAKLRELYVNGNRMDALPAGLFSGLSDLAILWLQHNPGEVFSLQNSLAKAGASEFKATIREGAPFEIVLPLTILGGTIAGGARTITIPKGALESGTLEVTRIMDSLAAVIVNIDVGVLLPAPPGANRDHRGYALARSGDLPLEVLPVVASTAVNLSVSPAAVAEDAGATTLTVTATLNATVRNDATDVTLSVGADGDTATAGTDYATGAAPALTIAAGDLSGTATLTVTPEDDSTAEVDETVTIGGTVTGEALTVNAAELTIIDDDRTPVTATVALTSDPDTTGPNDDTYAIGDVIEATATFTAMVTVTGTPQLELDIGGSPRLADCALATDATKLVCSYTVAAGDADTDGVAIAADKLTLNGGSITLGGDLVDPSHAAASPAAGHLVDGLRPQLTVAATSADGTAVVLTYDQPLSATTAASSAFTVTVSTANTAPSTPSITAPALNGSTVTLTIGTAIKAGQRVTVDYADPSAANDANAVQDAAGNDAASVTGQAVANTVPEDATVSALSMSLSSNTLTEGGAPVTVTVSTTAGGTFATEQSIALAWGGEALAPNAGLIRDQSGRSAVIVAAGETSGTVTLTGVERVAYTVPTTQALTGTVGDTQVGSENLTYMDSGAAPTATIAATPAMLPEGGDVTVTVTLSRAIDTEVAVALSMTDADGVVSGTLPSDGIAIAANETTGTVTLSTSADMMTGADAGVTFTLTDDPNAPYTLGTPATATVTVLDDTSASSAITLSVTPATVDEDAGATTLNVTATVNRAASTTATTVALSVAAGTATETTDYTATTATLTIAANQRTGTATLTLTPVDDTDTEPDETVTVQGIATGLTVTGAEVAILDDDEPPITLSFVPDTPHTRLAEEDGAFSVVVRATTEGATAPTRDIVVRVHAVHTASSTASAENGDFKPFDHTYTFAAGDFVLESGRYALSRSQDLELIDDATVEKDLQFHLQVDVPTETRHVTTPKNMLVVIHDRDTALVGFSADNYQVDEGEALRVKVVTSAPVGFPFTLTASTAVFAEENTVDIPQTSTRHTTHDWHRQKPEPYGTTTSCI